MPKLVMLDSTDSPESLALKLRTLVSSQELELESAELELLGMRAELEEKKLELEELRLRYRQAARLIRVALERLLHVDHTVAESLSALDALQENAAPLRRSARTARRSAPAPTASHGSARTPPEHSDAPPAVPSDRAGT